MTLLHKLILNLFLNVLALAIVDQLLEQMTIEGGLLAYMVIGVLVGIANIIIKPLLKLVAFPLMLVTAGLFVLVINAAVLYLVSAIVPQLAVSGVSFQVDGWMTFLLASVLFSVVNVVEHWIVHVRG